MPAWTQAPYALPYIAANDVLEQTPTTNREQMKKVSEYLEQIALPPGVIQAYVGTDAPDFWLLCDGSSYDPDKLPELSGVNADFHSDGAFRVPDFRGRSPIGATSGPNGQNPLPGFDGGPGGDWVGTNPAAPISLGDRKGDWRTANHAHPLGVSANAGQGTGTYDIFVSGQSATAWGNNWTHYGGSYDNSQAGVDHNFHPSTGVNFIIYAARPTKNVDLGKGSPITRVTTRDVVEARLADPNITEEERSMLEDQLASL